MSNIRKQPRLPNLGEIIILLVLFMVVMFSSVSIFEIDISLSLFIVWFIVIGFGLYLGHTYDDLQESIIKGITNGLQAPLIILAVGALIGTWIAGGVVPSIIYYGLELMHPSVFLPGTVIICAITSLATGTSWGTAGTAGIAMMGIGQSFGLPLPLVAGAVISGSFFGDKLSPISDTTVLTASLSKVRLMDHIRSMLYVSLPAILITAILFYLAGLIYSDGSLDVSKVQENANALSGHFNLSWYSLIPALIVIILLALNKPSIPTIAFGALLGVIWAWAFQGMELISALKTAYNGYSANTGIEFLDGLLNRGGIGSMSGLIAFFLVALGFGGLMDQTGVIKVVSDILSRWAKNAGRLTVSTIAAGFFGNFFGSAAFVALITATKMTGENYDKLKIDRRVLSRNAETGGTLTGVMIPWTENAMYMTSVLGVSTFAYTPFVWFPFVAITIAVIYGYTGKFIWYVEDESTVEEEYREHTQ